MKDPIPGRIYNPDPRIGVSAIDKIIDDVEMRKTMGSDMGFEVRLVKEIDELRQALSGRTVSCAGCNDLAAWKKYAGRLREGLRMIQQLRDECPKTHPDPFEQGYTSGITTAGIIADAALSRPAPGGKGER